MNGERQRILVVDDSCFNAKVLAAVLQDDYDVAIAKSGEACLEYVKANEVDLIFLDVVMPGLDGYEVCQKLKANLLTRDIPVVFVSAHDEVENQTKGLQLGAIDYLVRPAQPAVVRAKAQNYLALKKHHDMLEGFSFKDGLTGLFNRRYLNEHLERSWNEAFQQQAVLTLIFADVDYFKNYNDFYGHLAGDACLQKIAEAIQSSLVWPAAMAARYGGEEFMVILPGHAMMAAIEQSRRIQDRLAEMQLQHAKSQVNPFVTLSMGLASIVPTAPRQEKVLVEMADMALYKAKKTGRNNFQCFENPCFKRQRKMRF